MKPPPRKNNATTFCLGQPPTDAHALRVDDSVAVHGGDCRVHGVAPVQHHLPAGGILRHIIQRGDSLFDGNRFHGAYFPIFAQGMESTETAAYW